MRLLVGARSDGADQLAAASPLQTSSTNLQRGRRCRLSFSRVGLVSDYMRIYCFPFLACDLHRDKTGENLGTESVGSPSTFQLCFVDNYCHNNSKKMARMN